MVTVDLSEDRPFDRNFDWNVRCDGVEQAVQNWLICDKEYKFREGLLKLWIDGMPLKSIAALSGMRTSDLSRKIRDQKEAYFKRCEINHGKIEAILKREDTEYDYMVYQKTVMNELCALLMGGDEVKDVLEQLSNIGEANEF